MYLNLRDFGRDFTKGAEPNWIVIKNTDEMRKQFLSGMRGKNLGPVSPKEKTYKIQLDGWHDAHHTLTLDPSKLYLDAEVMLGDATHVMGMGAFVNSGDSTYTHTVKAHNNAEYWVCPSARKAFIVSTKTIPRQAQVLVSYERVHKFKDMDSLAKKLGDTES